jgi:propionyl-CoA carboxylase beta chain
MSWQEDVDELNRQRAMAEQMGGPTWDGDRLVGLKPSNTVIGTCRVNGRKVAFSGGDFTIRGGASDANIGNKRDHIEQLALSARIPFVRLLDATGGSVKTFEQIGRTYLPGNSTGGGRVAEMLDTIPVVSAVLGSVAGLPAVQACLCHFNVMVKNTSQVFVAGPKVVEQAVGRTITKEDLGDRDRGGRHCSDTSVSFIPAFQRIRSAAP